MNRTKGEVRRMAGQFASGNWHVAAGKEDEFIQRWTEFLNWTRETQPQLVYANLIRDSRDMSHFVSFAEWKSTEARDAWRQEPAFAEHFGACKALCDDMSASDYERAVEI